MEEIDIEIKKIIENFLAETEVLIGSAIKDDLITLRQTYAQELQALGCSPCMRNGLRAKYTKILTDIYMLKCVPPSPVPGPQPWQEPDFPPSPE